MAIGHMSGELETASFSCNFHFRCLYKYTVYVFLEMVSNVEKYLSQIEPKMCHCTKCSRWIDQPAVICCVFDLKTDYAQLITSIKS